MFTDLSKKYSQQYKQYHITETYSCTSYSCSKKTTQHFIFMYPKQTETYSKLHSTSYSCTPNYTALHILLQYHIAKKLHSTSYSCTPNKQRRIHVRLINRDRGNNLTLPLEEGSARGCSQGTGAKLAVDAGEARSRRRRSSQATATGWAKLAGDSDGRGRGRRRARAGEMTGRSSRRTCGGAGGREAISVVVYSAVRLSKSNVITLCSFFVPSV